MASVLCSTKGLRGLTQLRTLRASNNVLTELPDSLAQLQVGALAVVLFMSVGMLR
jgi:hypothetical protein